MLVEEFTKLTGYKPTFKEYAQIEREYHDFDGDKQEFCAIWSLKKVLEKFPLGLKHDIVQGLNYRLAVMYESGHKGTKHYRLLRNVILNVDF